MTENRQDRRGTPMGDGLAQSGGRTARARVLNEVLVKCCGLKAECERDRRVEPA